MRLWTTPMLLLATLAGRVPLHAAAVDIGGQGVAIAAPGGFGKTTLAAALAARGHRLMAEDITVVGDEDQRVQAGPDLLRLRPPSPDHLDMPTSWQTVAKTPSRHFVRTNVGDASSARLAAVVLAKRGSGVNLLERSDSKRIADLWQVSFHLPNMADRTRSFDAIVNLAESVPLYDLERPLDWSILERTADLVEGIVS